MKKISTLMIMLVSTFLVFPWNVVAFNPSTEVKYIPICGTFLRPRPILIEGLSESEYPQLINKYGTMQLQVESNSYAIGDQETFWAQDDWFYTDGIDNDGDGTIDDFDESMYQLIATCKRIGSHCYVFVENGQTVSDADLDYVMNQFDDIIYPTATATFGSEPNPGIDGDARIFILLMDIRDQNYHDRSYQYYIGGYFWKLNEYRNTDLSPPQAGYSNQKEIIYIDINPGNAGNSGRTIAHEFQHMIHWNQDGDEEVWIDEGCADYAEYVCYQTHPMDHVNAFRRNPNTQLNSWGGVGRQLLAHYGASYLFVLYIAEKYGGAATIRTLVSEDANGIDGVNAALSARGYAKTFSDVFKTWTIANYLDDPILDNLLGYTSIDINVHARHFSVPSKFNHENPVEKYASEYIEITPPGEMIISFDGNWLTNFLVRLIKIKGTTINVETFRLNWLKDGSLTILGTYDRIALVITRLDDWFGDGTYTVTLTALFDFYIETAPEKILYKLGETTKTTVVVTNTRGVRTEFWLGVSFKDSTGEYSKYNSQISITPVSATLDPGESTTFSVTWTIPSDAPTGYYQIAVNCWKDPSFKQSYTDNLDWSFIFYVYKLNILTPTKSAPAMAGDPNNPNQVLVSVEWIPRTFLFFMSPTFSIKIDNQPAMYELSDIWSQLFGIYTLKISPPTVPSEGLYDLNVEVTFVDLADSDTEQKAIRYVVAPPAEPIQKGLAWLRTRQYADGSWRNNVGVTSLAVLAFLNAGYDESDPTVREAINYILTNVRSDGSIYSSYPTYETSLAILPLVATRNNTYEAIIENAKNWLVNSQWDEDCLWGSVTKDDWYYGGFGYGWGTRPDLSNTQFALLALDAAGLPKSDPTWVKAQVFLHRCQNVNFAITLNIEGVEYTVQPYNHYGGYDGGFIYYPGASLAGGQTSYGSMTGAGIWGLLLSGVSKTDQRMIAAMNWVKNHYTWDTNPGIGWWRMYYYYLSMSKALTMYGEPLIDGHDWYQELYNKIVEMQIDAGAGQGYWSTSNEDYVPDLTTAYAILSLQTRTIAPPVQRLSYLTFILRSNCYIRLIDPNGNLVGYDYITGLGENQIPTAVYSGPFMEPQYIVIINPQAGTYRLELIGISEGPFKLTIQANYGEEVMDVFEYIGEIKPAELYGCDVTVTAIVGPIDVYANPPEFEEIIDNIHPTTKLIIGEPKHVSPTDNIYVSSATQFTLTAEDNPGGTGVASTFYRIYNNTYDTGWLEYSAPFYLIGLADGEYSIDYYSVDNFGNTEPTNTVTVILDNTPPDTTLTIGEPKYTPDTVYLTPDTPFTLEATDAGSGVFTTAYRIFNSSYDSGWQTYTGPFSLAGLADGVYTIEFNSTDNLGNTETTNSVQITLFSWNYIFTDSYGRGTILKINLAYNFIQFITPDKDYGIREAAYMRQCGRTIIIKHNDSELRLITAALDTKLDFCVTTAWDQQTRKHYLLIDKVGNE